VVDVITDDMPFLVDSLTMELARHGPDSDIRIPGCWSAGT
jgi:NAD-specific glutamate dehydrogenase